MIEKDVENIPVVVKKVIVEAEVEVEEVKEKVKTIKEAEVEVIKRDRVVDIIKIIDIKKDIAKVKVIVKVVNHLHLQEKIRKNRNRKVTKK